MDRDMKTLWQKFNESVAEQIKRTSHCRRPSGPLDYGDAATIGLNAMRRRGKDVEDCYKDGREVHTFERDVNKDYGIYLGLMPDGWTIGIIDQFNNIIAREQFLTCEEMRNIWQLD
jgi:hypothetical protein